MEINLYATLTAALVPLTLGIIWYHPRVFGKIWMKGAGLDTSSVQPRNWLALFAGLFLLSFILSFLMNIIAFHDEFIRGALYKLPDEAIQPGTEAGNWLAYYTTHLSDTNRTFGHGAYHAAFIVGLYTVLPVLAYIGLMERRSFKYVAVHVGFWVISVALMGGVVAGWR